MDAGPPPGAWAARKAENLRMTRMPCAASPALSPADSRHRHQRLARAASHGWPMGAKSMVATSFPGWIPRLRNRHLSRGYSTSQPLPKASCSIRARASSVNWRPPRALMPRGPGFAHSSSVRSSSEAAPVEARSRRICCTVTGRSRDRRSFPRHCSTYWTSSRSRPGRQRTSIHSHPRPGSARAAANSPGSGRPARRQLS